MTSTFRRPVTALLATALVLALSACAPVDKDADAADKADADVADSAASSNTIEGLKTDREQASYMIGMQLGRSLKPVKDEVDLDTVMKAIRTTLDDGKLLMTDEQAMAVGQAFGERLQAKQVAKGENNVKEGATFLAANGKKAGVTTTASGLQYQVLTAGKGAKPGPEDSVRVHYKGTLLDGTTFDSSYDRGEPVVFALSQVVPGWQEGLQLMPVGSKYRIWVPSALGYGEQGTPGGPIAANATLVFEVELQEIVSAPNGAAAQGAEAMGGPMPQQQPTGD